MAAAALVARAAAAGIRPLKVLVSSAFQNCSGSLRLVSTLSGRPFSHIQASLVAPAAKHVSPVRSLACGPPSTILNSVTPLLPTLFRPPARALTYCSLRKGKRKSVKAVLFRFLRLHSGLWLRRKAGYKKKLWKKKPARKKRLRELVFCNKTQSKLLDKMTTSFWKRRNWYMDDPYQKYQDRTNLRV
ncbi:39S ribosomal protein L35, mitochondrial [Antechinus flavipes]|uniref:39S ribosomal protein L35, mitochondrial n=1 Tax=Antechinus flavipes TaxID=38775 RepID=UPI002236535C|nr:39S ribosomal protein L35, mitochondrial [Antechinus flavipes]